MRRFLTVLFLLAAIGAALYFIYKDRLLPLRSVDPWSLVPEQSAAIITIPDAWNNWDRFTHTSLIWEACKEIPSFAASGAFIGRTVERMQNDAILGAAIQDAEVMICLMRDGSEGLGGLFIGIPRSGEAAPIESFAGLLGLDDASIATLRTGEVISYLPDTALPKLFIQLKGNIWLMSSSAYVMEEASLQMQSGRSLTQDDQFMRMHTTLGKGTDASLLLHARRSARLLELWTSPQKTEVSQIPDGWLAMDVRSRPDALLLSGLLGTENKAIQGSGRSSIHRVLPATVSMLYMDHVEDPDAYLAAIGSAAKDSLKNAMFSWVNGPVGHARAMTDASPNTWYFLEAGDEEEASHALSSLCGSGCAQQEHRGILLQQLPLAEPFKELFGHVAIDMPQPWWIILGDIVLFSSDPATLRASIDAWLDGNSLAEDPRTSAWSQRMSNEAARTWWCDIARSGELILPELRPSTQQAWKENNAFWQKLGGLTIQISPGHKGFVHVTAGLQHAPLQQQQGNGVLWETEVGASIIRGPFVVRNHNNNTLEVLVQDARHQLHLIGSTGKVLWSRQLNDAVLGQVHQVDRFKNGKLQLLFNTEKEIHLIDRNGKNVTGFPVVLKKKATAPLAVFDYENDKEYRILLADEDARILNFDLTGGEVNGWEKPRLPGTAVHTVQHFRIKNKDHLIVADATGKVHIFDRRGQPRERTSLELGPSPQIESIDAGSEIMATTICWLSSDGTLNTASLAGERGAVEAVPADAIRRSMDIDNDGENESVHASKDSLVVTRDGRQLFVRTLTGSTIEHVGHHRSGKQMLLSAGTKDGRIVLFDEFGKETAGSPVKGTIAPALADLNLDKIPELITADGNGRLIAYSIHALAEDP